jgi:two-component system cell cycle response regulator DivK
MPKILIVEDDEKHRDALSRHLQCRGFAIITAPNGKQGVEEAQNEKPDLVMMDLNMPELDGWEATRLLKAETETCNLPVIAMVAHALPGDRERAMEAGCAEYHIKPVDVQILLPQIETLLKGKC